jgi:2,5-diamino-6-(ribosylamino)-4(3H)-pyrimidinone 5'-phosphate reductase
MSTPAQSDDDHDETTMLEGSDQDEDESKLEEIDHDQDQNETENGAPAVSTESTDYSLFNNPPELARVRQSLFALEEGFEMSPTDFDAYFPFIDNVWRRARGPDAQYINGNETTDVYWCRLRKTPGAKPHVPRPTPEGKTARKKRVKEDKSCNMAMKVTFTQGPGNKVIVSRAVHGDRHTHDLDYMDAQKRNSAVMDVARRETMRAFLPTSVFWKMWTEPDKMNDAGGKYMKVSDVRNVQYAWRQENQSVPLKAHNGFNPQRAAQGSAAAKPKQRIKTSPKQVVTDLRPQAGMQVPPFSSHPPAYSAPPQQPPPPPPPPPQTHPSSSQYPVHQPPPRYAGHVPPDDSIMYPENARTFLHSYLPNLELVNARQRPHITITWASSLDGRIAISPGHRTTLSGPETKAMTHFLRSQHDAILIGVRTAIADDPALNCRLTGAGGYGGSGTHQQPRPIIIDPNARLHIRPEMNVLRVVAEGKAKAPWVVVAPHVKLHPVAVQTLKSHGGEFLMINDFNPAIGGFGWEGIFNVLFREGIKSIMIEGGGVILSELLKPKYAHLIDSVVTTIAPTYLGKLGVQVSQDSCLDGNGGILPTRLKDLKWQPMGENDVVMCGKPRVEDLQGLPVQQLQYVVEPAKPQQPPQPAGHPHSHAQQPQVNGHHRQNGSGSILQGIEEFSHTANAGEPGSRSPVAKRARKQ